MTDYERLALLALAEIILLLEAQRNPQSYVGLRTFELVQEIRAATVAQEVT
jgi:hypothetical protein